MLDFRGVCQRGQKHFDKYRYVGYALQDEGDVKRFRLFTWCLCSFFWGGGLSLALPSYPPNK